MQSMRLNDKVAIVTGGGAGIGKAIARRYAKEGARVIVAEILAERGQAVVHAIREQGGQATFVQTDVSSEEQVGRLRDATLERFGRIDVLVNNAAVLLTHGDGRAHELTSETWERTMNVNLRGYWLCAKYVVPAMLRQEADASSSWRHARASAALRDWPRTAPAKAASSP